MTNLNYLRLKIKLGLDKMFLFITCNRTLNDRLTLKNFQHNLQCLHVGSAAS